MVSRWWAVALLSLSVGLNLGLVVAVVQQRFAPPAAAPTVVVVPSPATIADAAAAAASPPSEPPEMVSEIAPPSVPVASPLRAAPAPREPAPTRQPSAPAPRPEQAPPGELDDLLADAGPAPHDSGEPGGPGDSGSPGAPDPDGPRGGGPSPARLEEMAERLGVPAADRPRFIELQRHFVAETRQRRIQLDAVRRALRAELLAANPDTRRLHGYVDDSARLQAALERTFVEHVLAARQLLDGEAERRYLQFLSRLGPRAGGPGPAPGQGRMGDPRWQRQRPLDRRPGGGGMRRPGAGRGLLDVPGPAPSPVSPV